MALEFRTELGVDDEGSGKGHLEQIGEKQDPNTRPDACNVLLDEMDKFEESLTAQQESINWGDTKEGSLLKAIFEEDQLCTVQEKWLKVLGGKDQELGILGTNIILRGSNLAGDSSSPGEDLGVRFNEGDTVKVLTDELKVINRDGGRTDYYAQVSYNNEEGERKYGYISINFLGALKKEGIANVEQPNALISNKEVSWKYANPEKADDFREKFPDLNATDQEVEDAAHSVFWNKENGFNNIDEAWKNPKFQELMTDHISRHR